MSIYEVGDVDHVKPLSALPEGLYRTKIVKVGDATLNKRETGKYIPVDIEYMDHEEQFPTTFYLSLVGENDAVRSAYMKRLRIKNFCALYGLTLDGGRFDTDEWMSAIAEETPVTQEAFNGKMQNRIEPPDFE
ncbi:MAG TPA: hypothetical protein ENI09_01510 [candidate division WWE3 bacterium]|uniref:DUF669 domain-containing protein n=1 Tax=candidate division WWE3 bacterium TaxID=2053526 RepID=A0A7C1NMG7_UNCKA|nr:hypothetical protein [candidate division WWE3 bacterium]